MNTQGETLAKLRRAVTAMGDEWLLIEEIDLQKDTFEILHNSLIKIGIVIPETGTYSRQNRQVQELVSMEYQRFRTEFCSCEGLRRHLTGSGCAECEYMVDEKENVWRRDRFRVLEWQDGEPTKVMWLHENIDKTKKNEWKQRQAVSQSCSQNEQAIRFKELYLKRISQELQEPINAIVGNAAVAKVYSSKPEQVMENMNHIMDSAKAAYRKVKQLEILDALQEEHMHMELRAFSIEQLIRNTKELLQPAMHARRQSLRIDAAQLYHEYVYADVQKLQQVLVDLLKNGCSYTQYLGEIYCGVREKPIDESYGEYEFYVQDNGVGMSTRFQKIMFEPFAKEYSDRVENTEGAGLGLVIVQSLVHMMGGEIRVETTYNKGTKISVHLRLKYAKEPEMNVGMDDVFDWSGWKNSHWQTIRFAKEHVLLVEDNDSAASAEARLLVQSGLTVARAINGEDAIWMFQESREHHFKLIVMNMNLPYINGYETIMGIRHLKREDAATVPVIALTSNLMAGGLTEEDYGIKAQLKKPILACELMEAVRKYIKD